MKAVVLSEFGGAEKLEYTDFSMPSPGPGEVLLKVKASSVNHLDIWIRNGLTSYNTRLPHIFGADISGIVASAGNDFNSGDKVIVAPGVSCFSCPACLHGEDNLCSSYTIMGAGRHGGYAEYVVVDENSLIKMPATISFEEAAAFPLTFLTSWHMLFHRAALQPAETLLVLGAGSGVGAAAVQMGKLAGARVIAIAGSDEKLEKAKQLGADEVINYKEGDFFLTVMKLTDRCGVDVVFEHVGPLTWQNSIRSLKKGGRLVTCGASTGATVDFDLRYLFSRQLSVFGSILGKKSELLQITNLIGRGKLKSVVDTVFSLSEARLAHEKMESMDLFGKLLLIPDH